MYLSEFKATVTRIIREGKHAGLKCPHCGKVTSIADNANLEVTFREAGTLCVECQVGRVITVLAKPPVVPEPIDIEFSVKREEDQSA